MWTWSLEPERGIILMNCWCRYDSLQRSGKRSSKRYPDLKTPEGPVVVLNYSKFRCDALVLVALEDAPCRCVPLDANFFHDAGTMRDELVEGRKDTCDEASMWSRVIKNLKDLGITKARVFGGAQHCFCPPFLSMLRDPTRTRLAVRDTLWMTSFPHTRQL